MRVPSLPATSHQQTRAVPPPQCAPPPGRWPRACPHTEPHPGHRGGGRRPGLAPVSPRARCVSVSSSAQLESFTFFSHLSSFSFFSTLLRRPFILSFYLLLLSSSFPFSSDPLRSISACFSFFPLFCSFFIYSFPFCPARRLPGPPVLAPSPPSLCSISLALFSGRCVHSSVFFPRISLLTPSPSPDSSRR